MIIIKISKGLNVWDGFTQLFWQCILKVWLCLTDINECQESSPCHQRCFNVIGSFHCGCEAGYQLKGRKCIGKSLTLNSQWWCWCNSVRECVHICVHMCRVQRTSVTWPITPHLIPLRQHLSLKLEFTVFQLDQAASKPQPFSYLCLPTTQRL